MSRQKNPRGSARRVDHGASWLTVLGFGSRGTDGLARRLEESELLLEGLVHRLRIAHAIEVDGASLIVAGLEDGFAVLPFDLAKHWNLLVFRWCESNSTSAPSQALFY